MKSFTKGLIFCMFFAGIVLAIIVTTPDSNTMTVPVTIIHLEKTPEERFQYAVGIILKHEGGLSNDKNDPGQITNYGISLRFLKNEHIDEDGDGVIDKDDIIHLDLSEADAIYLKYFWGRFHYGNIKDLNLATKIFDIAVNMGGNEAHKILKRAMNHLIDLPIAETGTINAGIIALVNTLNVKELIENIRTEEKDVYMQIVERNPHLHFFLKGWLARAEE